MSPFPFPTPETLPRYCYHQCIINKFTVLYIHTVSSKGDYHATPDIHPSSTPAGTPDEEPRDPAPQAKLTEQGEALTQGQLTDRMAKVL